MGFAERTSKIYAALVLFSTSSCLPLSLPKEEEAVISQTQPSKISLPYPYVDPEPNSVGLAGESMIAMSYQNTAALRKGRLYVYGLNNEGQIGNGDFGYVANDLSHPKTVNSPLKIAGEDWTFVAVGFVHICAIKNNDLYCWGSDQFGQLGIAGNSRKVTPFKILSNVKKVFARGYATYVINAQDELVWFGTKTILVNGELSPFVQELPKKILAQVKDVALSTEGGCAVHLTGALSCWGINQNKHFAQGDSGPDELRDPALIVSQGVVKVALSEDRMCVLLTDHSVKCAGLSLGDRLEDQVRSGYWGEIESQLYVSKFWEQYTDIVDISVHGAIRRDNGEVIYGTYYHNKGLPQIIAKGVRQIAFSENQLVAGLMFQSSTVMGWGSNLYGQLGLGMAEEKEYMIYQAKLATFP